MFTKWREQATNYDVYGETSPPSSFFQQHCKAAYIPKFFQSVNWKEADWNSRGYYGYTSYVSASGSQSSGNIACAFIFVSNVTCPQGQAPDAKTGVCKSPPPTCKAGQKLDSATNTCVPECPLRESKDSSGSCVADSAPAPGTPVPGTTSDAPPGQPSFRDPSQATPLPGETVVTKRWGGGLSCIGGWEFQYSGGFCVIPSNSDSSLDNCTYFDAHYTGNTCGTEDPETPSSGSPGVPGSTDGKTCDAGYTQGSITLNGVTTITCTPNPTNPGSGTGTCGGAGQPACTTNPTCGGTGQPACPTNTTCGGAGQPACPTNGTGGTTTGTTGGPIACGSAGVPCSVTFEPPFLPWGGVDNTAINKGFSDREGMFGEIAKIGDQNGLLSWAFLPEFPSYDCVAPRLGTGQFFIDWSGWCDRMGMVRDLFAYVLYIITLYAMFHAVTGSLGGGER